VTGRGALVGRCRVGGGARSGGMVVYGDDTGGVEFRWDGALGVGGEVDRGR
jgi:hypothetical protein